MNDKESEALGEFLRHPCPFCKRPLDEEYAVKKARDQARRRKQSAPRPGEVYCLRKDCEKARKRKLKEGATVSELVDEGQALAEHDNPQDSHHEGELFSGIQTRKDEDGQVRTESTRIDFDFLTSHELKERERDVKKTTSRTDRDIVQDLLDSPSMFLGERCKAHGTPGCTPCRMVEEARRRIVPRVIKFPLQPSVQPRTKINTEDLEREVQSIIRKRDPQRRKEIEDEKRKQRKGSRKYNQRGYNESEKPKTKKHPNQTPNVERLREQNHYSVREVAALLDHVVIVNARVGERDMALLVTDPKFRKLHDQVRRGTRRSYPRTWAQLLNELPTKWRLVFASQEIALYKDYASGNVALNELKQRVRDGVYGETDFVKNSLVQDVFGITDFDPVLLENKIISLAWQAKLLKPANLEVRGNDKERDLDEAHDLEAKGIKTGAVDGGSVIERGQSARTGRTLALDSFERGGQILRTGPGESADSDSAKGTLEDGYGEEDAA